MNPIYGPVPSWRLGRSLGIDPLSCRENTCSFDCVYCQLGRTIHKTKNRKEFVDKKIIEKRLSDVRRLNKKADIITLSGTGEPTLAKNLGKIIDIIIKNSDLPIAVLTNSSLIYRRDVQKDLKKADFVVAKLDATDDVLFKKINRPVKGITYKKIIDGIRSFRKQFKGRLALQMMFIEENKDQAVKMAGLAKGLKADEVQINTPLRPCAVKPLNKNGIRNVKSKFRGMDAVSVYDAIRPKTKVICMDETLIRRPKI